MLATVLDSTLSLSRLCAGADKLRARGESASRVFVACVSVSVCNLCTSNTSVNTSVKG